MTGSGDGSIRVWEWGVGQPLYTARVAGQHGKVTKLAFSSNGNKFAAVDGDGMLCLWQAHQSTEHKKPFFVSSSSDFNSFSFQSQKAHSKSAADVRFIGHTSSLLLTAGYGSGDQNLALWDTLLPHSKAMIQTWTAHTEGATCALYLAAQQVLQLFFFKPLVDDCKRWSTWRDLSLGCASEDAATHSEGLRGHTSPRFGHGSRAGHPRCRFWRWRHQGFFLFLLARTVSFRSGAPRCSRS